MSLLSALYTGVSGLQAYGDSLQVIGDNIANVNTTAFKKARAEFSDMLSQTINGSSGRSQLGHGVRLSSISTSFAQGSFSSTDRLTDMAVNGNGFFVVNDGTRDYYTRNGEFSMNSSGELITSDGMKLQGYQYDATGTALGTMGTLKISNSTVTPTATSNVSINANLNSTAATTTFDVTNAAATSNASTTIAVYDSLGTAHDVTVYFNKTGNNAWSWHAVVDGGELSGGTAGTPTECATGDFTFNSDGSLQTSTTTSSSFNFTGTAQSITFDFGTSIAAGGNGFDGTTQYSASSTINSQSQNGFAAGSLSSVSVDSDGVISGIYSNGKTITVGQIALANFSNLNGLYKAGSGIYRDTSDSGVPVIGRPNSGNLGSVSDYSLELSNVDLATEFVNLISTQSAYEANSKVITTGNSLLQTITGLVR